MPLSWNPGALLPGAARHGWRRGILRPKWIACLPERVEILVIEDETLIRMMIEDALTEAGFAVTSVANGHEAIALLGDPAQSFAGAVTDVRLGRSPDGWEVARQARETRPGIAIVYITGDSGHEWSAKGVPNSVVLGKPFAIAQITTAVATLLNAAAVEPHTAG